MGDERPWLNYEGQPLAELVELSKTHSIDSIVSAISGVLRDRFEADGAKALTREELLVLAANHFEEEVNSGGFEQAFAALPELVPHMQIALTAIGRADVAALVRDALDTLGLQAKLTARTVEAALERIAEADDDAPREALEALDEHYYAMAVSLAEPLLVYVQANAGKIVIS
jgi:Domain of unknown function (DUF4375)